MHQLFLSYRRPNIFLCNTTLYIDNYFLQINNRLNDDDDEDEPMKGVPDIKIKGNVIKIERKDVVWSSDEYEESEDEDTPGMEASNLVFIEEIIISKFHKIFLFFETAFLH
jgi:hypothetical protein